MTILFKVFLKLNSFEARENVQNGLSLNNLVKEQYDLHKSHILKDAVEKCLYIQQYIIDGIQYVYQSKVLTVRQTEHEIIVKQMTSKCESSESRRPVSGEITDLEWAESVNRNRSPPPKQNKSQTLLF
jgi:hypothetical protein